MLLARIVLPVALLWSSLASGEQRLHLELSGGGVHVANEDYEEGWSVSSALGYSSLGYMYRLGAIHMADMAPDRGESDIEGEVVVNGAYVSMGKRVEFDAFTLELGAGIMYSDTAATLNERDLVDDRDSSPLVYLRAAKGFGQLFSIHAGWQYLDAVSGGDLHLLQLGMGLSF